jgi:hypothetical protein
MPVVPSVYRCAQGTYNLHPNNDQRNTQESLSKAKSFTSAEGFATNKGLISKHTKQEVCLGFYP